MFVGESEVRLNSNVRSRDTSKVIPVIAGFDNSIFNYSKIIHIGVQAWRRNRPYIKYTGKDDHQQACVDIRLTVREAALSGSGV